MDTLDLMRSFVAVVDTSSFTEGGRRLGRSKALISKHVGELESRLGARLLNRTTRRVGVTELGRAYYERARALLAEFDTLEEQVRADVGVPRGTLKITAPSALGELELMELVCAFRERYPDVETDIFLSDRVVDLIGEGFDIALRVTEMTDSSLIARKLCDMNMMVCAAPGYIERAGRPKRLEDIASHSVVADTNIRGHDNWRFLRDGEPVNVRIRPTIQVNSALAVRRALLANLGISKCPEFAVARDIREGRLVDLFPGASAYKLAVHLVYPHRLHLSAKVRAFIDYAVDWYAPEPPWNRPGDVPGPSGGSKTQPPAEKQLPAGGSRGRRQRGTLGGGTAGGVSIDDTGAYF